MIMLSAENAAAIGAEGEAAYPNECCGVLLGKLEAGTGGSPDRRETESLLPVVNKREDAEQYHRFEITPEDYLHAEKEARRQNRDILGFYHSHPDHPAIPSDFDKNNALPFYSYVIVSVAKGKAAGLRSWELVADRSEFREEDITWR
ncbi:MAG: M67 family metallopeptidase [Treponema sp.]|jgi:proteasome lid subunit RPN8/RPN11|nr:M67 family metallopeptidase [Treponema sp.]